MPTTIAKLFKSGNSQAVRLPKAFRLPGDRARISRRGRKIVLEPMDEDFTAMDAALERFSDDFLADGRRQPPMPPPAGGDDR